MTVLKLSKDYFYITTKSDKKKIITVIVSAIVIIAVLASMMPTAVTFLNGLYINYSRASPINASAGTYNAMPFAEIMNPNNLMGILLGVFVLMIVLGVFFAKNRGGMQR